MVVLADQASALHPKIFRSDIDASSQVIRFFAFKATFPAGVLSAEVSGAVVLLRLMSKCTDSPSVRGDSNSTCTSCRLMSSFVCTLRTVRGLDEHYTSITFAET